MTFSTINWSTTQRPVKKNRSFNSTKSLIMVVPSMQIKLITPLHLSMCLAILSFIQTHGSIFCTISIQNEHHTVPRETVLGHFLKPILLQITNCRQSWFLYKPLRVKMTQMKIIHCLPEKYGLCLMRITISWSSYFKIPISSKIRHNIPLRVIPNIINPYLPSR